MDSGGRAHVAGHTESLTFPTKDPFQPFNAGGRDAFVTRLEPAGSLSYSTYLGGTGEDGFPEQGGGVAVDPDGNTYLTGNTRSTDFPLKQPLQAALGGSNMDLFITKLAPSGSALVYSTYLGGSNVNGEWSEGVAVDGAGRAHVTGRTFSADFPLANAYQDTRKGLTDVFVSVLESSGAVLAHSTLLGGGGTEFAGDIATDTSGNAYVTGETEARDGVADFPTKDAYRGAPVGNVKDAFLTKLSPEADLSLAMTASPDPVDAGRELVYALTVRNLGPEPSGATVRDALPAGAAFVSASGGCGHAGGIVTCEIGQVAAGAGAAPRLITVRPAAPDPALTNTASVKATGVDPEAANDSASVTSAVVAAPGPPGGGGTGGGGVAPPPPASGPASPAPAGTGGPVGAAIDAAARRRASEQARARRMRSCLARARSRVRRAARRARRATPAGSARRRSLLRRVRRRGARLRKRCRDRHGKTPGRVTGLRARGLSRTRIALSFRAPATDGKAGSPARTYLVRQAPRPMRRREVRRRERALCRRSCRLRPRRAGDRVRLVITRLRPRTSYYYRVAARDNVSRRLGPPSRLVRARTR